MIRFRNRHKRILVTTAVLLLGTVLFFQLRRGRVERYRASDRTEGIVDALARGIPEDHPSVRFVEVSEEAGLVFRHFPGPRTNRLPEDMGTRRPPPMSAAP